MSHPKRPLAAVLLIFILLSFTYNWATPLFENSDEFFHFPFIKYLADHNWALPYQSRADLQDWRQQGNQPPIYHMLAALLIKPLSTDDYAEMRRINPHAQIGIVGETNINAVLHPLDRSREFSAGTAFAVRLVRAFSLLWAGVVVVCAYFLTIYTFPNLPRWVGVLAAALVAFNPMFVFVSASINNDNLSNAMIAAILTLLAWLYRQPDKPQPRVMLLIGVCLGVSLLSKLSTGPFMGVVGLYWLALAQKHQAWGYMVKWGFVTVGVAGLISGWWYLHNYNTYGDPTGLTPFLDIVGRRAIPLTPEQLWSEREGFIQSFWGLFGGMTVPMSDFAYWVFNALCGASLAGLGLFYWKRRTPSLTSSLGKGGNATPPLTPPLAKGGGFDLPQGMLFLWAVVSFISLIRWTALTWASQGRLWFVAITCLAALSAVGFYEIGRRVKMPALSLIPVGYSLVIAILAPFIWIRPAYAVPVLTPLSPSSDYLTDLADPDYPQEIIRVVAADFPTHIQTGDHAQIHLVMCSLTELSRDWSVFVHLVNDWDIILAQADFTPARGTLPTSEVEAGLCWEDIYPVKIGAGIASEDTPLKVLVGVYDARYNTRMVTAEGLERLEIAQTRLDVGDELQKFVLGDAVRLADYSLSESVVKAGEHLTITLNWESLQPLDGDYTVFVQILNPTTSYRAGASDQTRSTSQWEQGELIPDEHTLTIASDAPAGVYAVIVGLYQQTPEGGFARLRLSYDGVDTGFDYLSLTQVKIE